MRRVIALALLLGATAPRAAPLYTITDLGTLGGHTSVAHAISNNGQVVGQSNIAGNGIYQPFIWEPSTGLQPLTGFGVPAGTALGVNSAGEVVGWRDDERGNQQPFYWSSAAGLVLIGTLGGESGFAHAIDETGVIVGGSQDSSGRQLATVWSGGTSSALPTPLDKHSYAYDINSSGDIAGRICSLGCSGQAIGPAIWFAAGAVVTVDTPGSAFGVNDAGTVVGGGPGPQGAFAWDSMNGYRALPTLGGINAVASDINVHGAIVGSAFPVSNTHTLAVLWTPDGTIVDLTAQVVDLSGWQYLNAAYAINDGGWIVGFGQTATGDSHAFLLQPVPIPAAGWLFGSALSLLISVRRTTVAHS